jgi:hypothetical protein
LAPLAVVGSLLGSVSAASASTPATNIPSANEITGNWAGYYATKGISKPEAVFGSFTVPRVSCNNSVGRSPFAGSIWAGIGGMPDDVKDGRTAWLEQSGIQITCMHKHQAPRYQAFYEIVRTGGGMYGNPYDAHMFADVSPGDKITARVIDGSYLNNTEFFMGVNVTHNGHTTAYGKSAFLPRSAYTGQTAEVITEWPSGPSDIAKAFSAARQAGYYYDLGGALNLSPKINPEQPLGDLLGPDASIGLVDMGNVNFSNAAYLTHVPGDPKPEGFPVMQYKLGLFNVDQNHQTVMIIPTNPTSQYGFTTNYLKPIR